MNIAQIIYDKFKIDGRITNYVLDCEREAGTYFAHYEEVSRLNQFKVVEAFKKNKVSSRHFNASTGYGYGDEGRDALMKVFADSLGCEDAIVSPMFMSGTHAISSALFGSLLPGDKILFITGQPYDTLKATLTGEGSLAALGILSIINPLLDAKIDLKEAVVALKSDPAIKMIYIQRSTGYDIRPAFTSTYINGIISELKKDFPDKFFFVDNCYGEFVCPDEPVKADIMAGSLIKNPGGGLAPTGGYIAGKKYIIDKVANRYSAPGVGTEIGSYAFGYQQFYQGLFMAPHTVLQALKGVILASVVFLRLGFKCSPKPDEERGDITQTILFGNEERLTSFVRGIQRASAVDGHVVPYAWDMPGYDNKVIMAAGTFVQGASIELSADAPIREPYCAYLQGALTYEHAFLGMLYALSELQIYP